MEHHPVESGMFYEPRSSCRAYRNHYHVGSPHVLVFRLSIRQIVQALCVLVRITELGLLPGGAAISRIEVAVRKLRSLLGGWRLVPTEQLLFAAARVGSVIRFRDKVDGGAIGIVDAFSQFGGFPWRVMPPGVSEMGIERARLAGGFQILSVMMEIASALPEQLVSVPGEPVIAALNLISTVRQHQQRWKIETEKDCECGAV